jgi:predicted DNA-binding protein
MPSPGTPRRSIRISDDLWDRARNAADHRGDDLAAVIREALELYVKWAAPKAPTTEDD